MGEELLIFLSASLLFIFCFGVNDLNINKIYHSF